MIAEDRTVEKNRDKIVMPPMKISYLQIVKASRYLIFFFYFWFTFSLANFSVQWYEVKSDP